MNRQPLALDCETALIAPGRQAPPLACVAFSAGGSHHLEHHSTACATVWDVLHSDVLIVGHNIAYDFAVIANHDFSLFPAIIQAYESDRVTDTEIRQKLTDIAGGVYRGFDDTEDGHAVKINYSLEDVALRLLNRQLDKNSWRLRYGELVPLPLEAWPEGARLYPVEDTRATLDVFGVQEANAGYLQDQYRQTRAALWLRLMSAWGIRTDRVGVENLARITKTDYERIAADLRAAGLLRPDKIKRDGTIKKGSRNMKAARSLMVQACNNSGKELPLTKTRSIGLDKLACKESGDPLLVKYAELTSLRTVLSKDIPALEQGIYQPIHSRFEVLLETGRTSSSGPNIQNPRRKPGVRECFVPRDGFVFASADYSGIELCTLAQCCYTLLGYSKLGDALNNDLDAHTDVASALLGISYSEAERRKKEQDPILDDARQTGKVANFGFPGGLGPKALVYFAAATYNVKLTVERATDLKFVWLSKWTEMPDYFRYIGSHTDAPFPSIEQLFSKRHRGGVGYTEACNSLFQGLAADIAKAAGWEIMKRCYTVPTSALCGCRIVNFVHDEFIIEAPEHRAHEAALELSEVMLAAAKPWLPNVKVKAEPETSRRWSKNSKAVWKDGRLIPWDTF